MKQIIFITIWAGLGAFVTHQALADCYEQSEQYKIVKAANESLKRIKAGDV
ncbi:hypothetical protein ACTXMF_12215 [Psychrobacter celer]|uniref:hypothetical protein n=1 Tax=Psychrobacter celer TaxID=306572 RepID=UPI003FCF75F9